jgi:hypothetical protein
LTPGPPREKAAALRERRKVKTEMDQEALDAMLPHLKETVA